MSFPDFVVQAVWEKGKLVPDFDRNVWRWDDFGNPIKRNEYGNRDSKFGWEIDHKYPVTLGGSDDLSNLRPLQWQANVRR